MARPDNLHQPSNFSPLFWEPSLRLPARRKDRSASGSHTIPNLLKIFSELKRGRTRRRPTGWHAPSLARRLHCLNPACHYYAVGPTGGKRSASALRGAEKELADVQPDYLQAALLPSMIKAFELDPFRTFEQSLANLPGIADDSWASNW